MPTYEYVCAACGHALEIFQTMSESPRRKCPQCGKPKLERRIGAGAGFLFKGSGFYLTDYRSKSYTARNEAERNAEAKGQPGPATAPTPPGAEAPAAGKSDSKSAPPAAKSPAPKSPAPKPGARKPSTGD